jgi:molybdate transport system ATP-binding protein
MALTVDLRATAPIPLDARFAVNPGEIAALVGPSGSGKSTILRTIAGLWKPSEGVVAVGGQRWLDTRARINLPTHARRVGMVFQSYALFPHMTALGNVMAALGHLPAAERPARARALLSLVNLAGLEDRRQSALSGGQQQRVAVARALAREPAALLLDEPFSAVDRATRERLYREIGELRRVLNMPVLLVTHDIDEAARLADRMIVLHHGRTLQEGPPLEVMSRPASPDVARLVGMRNLFEAEAIGRGGDGRVRLDWNGIRLVTESLSPVAGRVAWSIPDGYVILHRRDRPSRGEHENPVPGLIDEMFVLGQTAHLRLRPQHAPDWPIHLSVPLHVAQRNAVRPGVAATVSLLAEGIHIMSATAPEGMAAPARDASAA